MKSFNIFNPIHLMAVGFGAGLLPKAPGTWGTLVGIPLYLGMAPNLPGYTYGLGVVILFALGCYFCHVAGKALGEPDHGSIVWDEIVGYLITMVAVPSTWFMVVAGFLFFRLFDITKPFPIRLVDRYMKNGVGVMLDDVLAGVMANLCLHLLVWSGLQEMIGIA